MSVLHRAALCFGDGASRESRGWGWGWGMQTYNTEQPLFTALACLLICREVGWKQPSSTSRCYSVPLPALLPRHSFLTAVPHHALCREVGQEQPPAADSSEEALLRGASSDVGSRERQADLEGLRK